MKGLINEDDNGRTDLGTLEKQLQNKDFSRRTSIAPYSEVDPNSPAYNHGTPSTVHSLHATTPKDIMGPDPRSNLTSPEPPSEKEKEREKEKEKENEKGKESRKDKDKDKAEETPSSTEEVEALSDMMCSLVTNNCGETRYIGKFGKVVYYEVDLTTCRIILRIFHILT